eukprot:678025-Hanusia_phi.AAC.1
MMMTMMDIIIMMTILDADLALRRECLQHCPRSRVYSQQMSLKECWVSSTNLLVRQLPIPQGDQRLTDFAAAEKEEIRSKLTTLKTSPNPVEELRPHVGTKDLVVMSFVLGHLHPRQAGYEVRRLCPRLSSVNTLDISSVNTLVISSFWVVKQAAACLKPGGHFLLAELNGGAPFHGQGHGHGHGHEQHGHEHGHGHEQHGHGHEHGSGEACSCLCAKRVDCMISQVHHDCHGHEHGHGHAHDEHEVYYEDQLYDLLAQAGLSDTKTEKSYTFTMNDVTVKCVVITGMRKKSARIQGRHMTRPHSRSVILRTLSLYADALCLLGNGGPDCRAMERFLDIETGKAPASLPTD